MRNKTILKNFILYFCLLLGLGCSACGGGSDDTCNCQNGLICQDGICVCNSDDCCTSNEDCSAGQLCDLDTNTCYSESDGDTESDTDTSTDGDTEIESDDESVEDGDQSESDDEIIDGDTTENADMEVDETVDGDTDDEIVASKSCRYGLDKLMDLASLPMFENGTTTHQSSSRDPQEANNDSTTTNLYMVNQTDYAIMHSKVPGCIYRMWFADMDNIASDTLNFYLNGATSPTHSFSMKTFFASNSDGTPLESPTSPFLSPFAGALIEEKTFYSYVPICYTSEILVTVSGPNAPNGWQVTWQDHPDCNNLEDFSLGMNMTDAISTLETELGSNPKAAYDDEKTYSGNIALLNAGTTSSATLSRHNISTPEVVTSFKLTIPQASKEVIDNLWVDIYWDGKNEATEANVSAPVSVFFGGGDGSSARNSLMVGYDLNGNFYCYWPMPYWSDAVVKLTNNSTTNLENIYYEFVVGKHDLDKSEAGHFHTKYNQELPTTEGKDFKVLETTGKGHVVGISMSMNPATVTKGSVKDYLYGDERTFIDGMNFPMVRGTSTRNFFNGNPWASSYEHPLFSVWNPRTFKYSGTRLMFSDSIVYNRSISMGFEVGGANDDEGDYRSAVYYYHSCLDGMILSDEIEVDDQQSVENHEYTQNSIQTSYTELQNIEGSYEGEDHETTSKDTGNGIYTYPGGTGAITFKLDITDTNQGIRLVRKQTNVHKTGNNVVNQNATVLVGGENADISLMTNVGNWYTTGGNTQKIWQESVFDIPARYTSGKDKIKVIIQHDQGNTDLDGLQKDWNIFNLKAYSYLPNSTLTEGPGTVSKDDFSYSVVGTTPCLSWQPPPEGSTPAFYHIFRSGEEQAYSCVSPTGEFSEYHVATTTDTYWCEPEPLDKANSNYYYRILSEDCTSQVGTCSDRFTVKTGIADICFEGEDFQTYYSSNNSNPDYDTEPAVYGELTDSSYSGGKALYFKSYATVHQLTFLFNLPYEGTYDVETSFVKTPDSGIIKIRTNYGDIDTNIDLYNYENQLSSSTAPSSISAQPGISVALTYRVTDKNPVSANYYIGIDKICFRGREVSTDK